MSLQTSEQVMTQNNDYQAATIIQMRLDTSKILADIEAFLRGTRVMGYSKDETGNVVPVFHEYGRPRMNDKGVQDMMGWFALLINPQTVQGNKTRDEFYDYTADMHADIAQMLMTNLHDYDISENDYESICDKIMHFADMFFSRTIDNKERDSYAQTLKSIERHGEERGGLAGLNPFRGG